MSFPPFQAIDREAVWVALFNRLSALTAAPWAANMVTTTGTVVTDPQGHLQEAQNDGTTGVSAPSWNDAGGETTDNAGPDQIIWRDTGAGFVSIGRKHKAPPDLSPVEQPALFIVQVKERHIPKPPFGAPSKIELTGYLILYLTASAVNEDIGQETELAASQMNALYFAIDQVLLPDNPITGKFTLGGLVEHCWIEGDTDQDPGILGQQAAAILPIHILVP